ncbi:MAG: hypothetical protein L0154_25655 [Chloroflexi bacterium]|nr:hypothetical protein [Chloroflexota bacterium]
MSYQEKRNILYLISSLLVFTFYWLYVLQLNREGDLESTNWGIVILVLVPVHVVVNVILEVLFVIINTVTEGEQEPSVVDEFDQSIQLRATRNAYLVFIIGFLIAMGTVALEMPMYVMFNLLVFSFFLTEVVWSTSHLYFYRRGL